MSFDPNPRTTRTVHRRRRSPNPGTASIVHRRRRSPNPGTASIVHRYIFERWLCATRIGLGGQAG
jgi:flavin-dependent dehydrogenase